MSKWWPGRQGLQALAVLSAALTGAFGIALGGSPWHVYGAYAYILLAALASFSPAAIAVQVLGGQVLVGSLLTGPGAPSPLLLVPPMACVIVSAELLAVVARMDTPLESHPRRDLSRAGLSAVIGGAVFAAVMLVNGFRGPDGVLAILLASGACVLLATLLARNLGLGKAER